MKIIKNRQAVEVDPTWTGMSAILAEMRGMRKEMEILKAEVDRLRMQNDLLRAENDRLKATGVELYRRLIEAHPDEGDDEAYLRLAKRLP